MRIPQYVEVETSRYCNRVCEWCPNASLNDRRIQELLPWSCLEAVVTSLAKVAYGGWFAFHNYNEPLANPRIIDEVALVSRVLPSARPSIFTNGDRLTDDIFAKLAANGLAHMRVTVYPRKRARQKPSFEALWMWLERRPFLRSKAWKQVTLRQGPALMYGGPPEIVLICPEIDGYYDRGGTVQWLSAAQRHAPCYLTSRSLSIDYLGNIKMCCNVVTGADTHREHMLGNVKDIDVIDVWNSPAFEAIRERHTRSDWSTTTICRTCTQELKENGNAS